MSTQNNFQVFQQESWRPALRQFRRKLLRKSSSQAQDKIIVIGDGKQEKWDSVTTFNGHSPAESITDIEAGSTFTIDAPASAASSSTELEVEATTFTALQIVAKNTYALVPSLPLPTLNSPTEIEIRVSAVGLNPIDWKSVSYNFCLPSFPWVTGRECSGIVTRLGSEVSDFKVGDRVWTSTYYRDVRAGCFQELVVVPQHTVKPIPSNLNFEQAAILGVGPLTSAMTLWRWLGVPRGSVAQSSASQTPSAEREAILIWGGSTSTGQIAIQICAQAGLDVIAVASSKTSDLVRSLGAHHVITRDGKSNEEIVSAILAVGGDRITRGLDLVGGKTAALALSTLSKTRPCVFAPLAMMSATQEVADNVTVVNVEMKQFVLDVSCSVYADELNTLVESGKLRLPELEVLEGGLGAVQEGLERVKLGDMGGKKIVVRF